MISEFYQFYLAAMNDFSEQIAALSPSEAMNSEQRSQPTRENQIKAEKISTEQRILQYFKPEEIQRGTFTQPDISLDALAQQFKRSELPTYPITVDDYYRQLFQEVLPYAIDTGSPTYIGHMTSALPDFLHDMSKLISKLNQNLVKIETSKSLKKFIFLIRS